MSWHWHWLDQNLSIRCKLSNTECGDSASSRDHDYRTPDTAQCTSINLNEVGKRQLQTSLSLQALPNEIHTHIFTFLAKKPPSRSKSLCKPEHDLTHSAYRPLKQVSLTNARLRRLALPILFQAARLDPCQLTAFLSFAHKFDVARHVTSAVVQLQGPQNHIHPPWWSRLLEKLDNLASLTVVAAPHVFAEIGQLPIETSHSWAFKIPYHSLTLDLNPNFVALPDKMSRDPRPENINTRTTSSCNLLTIRPWMHLMVNESSHLPAYSTYEYFLKIPPSLITSLYHRQHAESRVETDQPSLSSQPYVAVPIHGISPTSLLTNLISFSYVAIFPFYNHVDEILKCVRQMTRLRRFFVKLCPEPDSTALQDELERNGANAGRTEGRIDVNDPWNEYVHEFMSSIS